MKIDHTPYLTDANLCTAQDVLDLLEIERASAVLDLSGEFRDLACEQRPYGETFVGALVAVERILRSRIDRERRQACRRAAAWFIKAARAHRDDERDWASAEPDDTFSRELFDAWAESARSCRRIALQRALAFRAAARTP